MNRQATLEASAAIMEAWEVTVTCQGCTDGVVPGPGRSTYACPACGGSERHEVEIEDIALRHMMSCGRSGLTPALLAILESLDEWTVMFGNERKRFATVSIAHGTVEVVGRAETVLAACLAALVELASSHKPASFPPVSVVQEADAVEPGKFIAGGSIGPYVPPCSSSEVTSDQLREMASQLGGPIGDLLAGSLRATAFQMDNPDWWKELRFDFSGSRSDEEKSAHAFAEATNVQTRRSSEHLEAIQNAHELQAPCPKCKAVHWSAEYFVFKLKRDESRPDLVDLGTASGRWYVVSHDCGYERSVVLIPASCGPVGNWSDMDTEKA